MILVSKIFFQRELKAIGNKTDILIAISTSGNSQNVINLVNQAEKMGINFYIFTGKLGKLSKYNDKCIKVQSDSAAIIQQVHITIGHIIVGLVEKDFLKEN